MTTAGRRFGTPEEVAAMVAALVAHPAGAEYVTRCGVVCGRRRADG
jgi:NAD(P)-dependent dehydrogenase (short-subunit alcohol dehydrogenase family)